MTACTPSPTTSRPRGTLAPTALGALALAALTFAVRLANIDNGRSTHG